MSQYYKRRGGKHSFDLVLWLGAFIVSNHIAYAQKHGVEVAGAEAGRSLSQIDDEAKKLANTRVQWVKLFVNWVWLEHQPKPPLLYQSAAAEYMDLMMIPATQAITSLIPTATVFGPELFTCLNRGDSCTQHDRNWGYNSVWTYDLAQILLINYPQYRPSRIRFGSSFRRKIRCPFCEEFHETTLREVERQYIDTGVLRFCAHNFLADPPASLALQAARRADDDDRFWPMHELLHRKPAVTDLAEFLRFAGVLGFNLTDLRNCLVMEKV